MISQNFVSKSILSFITVCFIHQSIYAETTGQPSATPTVMPPSSSQAGACPCDFNVNEIKAAATKMKSPFAQCIITNMRVIPNSTDKTPHTNIDMELLIVDNGAASAQQLMEQAISWGTRYTSGMLIACSKKFETAHQPAANEIIKNEAQYQACVQDLMKAAASFNLTCKP